jgi:imidazolonepropionase-like amidohydrolase
MIRAVHAGGILDPVTGETTRDAVVVIEDGRVTRAGPRSLPIARSDSCGCHGPDGPPCLIDCHVHLTNLGEGLDCARATTLRP